MVVTEVIVKLIPRPPCAQLVMASFADVHRAGDAVAAVIGAGIIPAALEMMDRKATAAVEPFVRAGYDLEAAAILLVESDGTAGGSRRPGGARSSACCAPPAPARCASRPSEAERLRLWSGRKNAFPAAGRISPDYYCMDGTIPRKHVGRVLEAIEAMEARYRLRCMNVFHAGDGNLHPVILFDANEPGSWERAERFGARDPRAVRGTRRHHHRRTRRGAGEDQLHVRAVLARRARRVLRGQGGLRSGRPAQSGQAHPDAACAAPSTAGCTCTAAPWRTRICRASRTGDEHARAGIAALRERVLRRGRARYAAAPAAARAPRTSTARRWKGRCSSCAPTAASCSYEPSELVITRALRHAAVARSRRRLPLRASSWPSSRPASRATRPSGGVIAAGLSGPRRMYAGAARDFVLGTRLLTRGWRGAALRRRGHEERRRLRCLAPVVRLARHPRDDHGSLPEGAAAAPRRGNRAARCRRPARR